MSKNLDYQREIFIAPMQDFKKKLTMIQNQMMANEEDDGLFDDFMMPEGLGLN